MKIFFKTVLLLFLAIVVIVGVYLFQQENYKLQLAEPKAFSETQNAIQQVFENLKNDSKVFTLSNGLRVVYLKRDTAPVFAAQIHVKVGGVDEEPGKSGSAHMLEHMAFKGTETIGEQIDNEFSAIYKRAGAANLNAGTSKDYTYYTVGVPTNAFELWCSLESERLIKPVFRQFYTERDVVIEERRMRVDSSPDGTLYENLLQIAFKKHPYRIPTIGTLDELVTIEPVDVEEMHKKYYVPKNIVIALVGDLDENLVREKLEIYFGESRFSSCKDAICKVHLETVFENEPEQTSERREVIIFDAQPQILIGYHKPVYPNKDDITFMVLHSILNEGRSSIFKKELVEEKQLALNIGTGEAPGSRYPNLFIVKALPRIGVANDILISEIQNVFERLKNEGISSGLLDSAKKRAKVDFMKVFESQDDLAYVLAQSELMYNNKDEYIRQYDLLEKVTVDDVKEIIEKYLNINQRTVVEIK